MKPVVGFVGMTHLGLVSASAVAGAGFETVCFDRDEALVANLRRASLPVLEPALPELIASNGARQTYSANAADIARCDVVYVAPDIATDDEGRSDDGPLRELIDLVRPVLRTDAILVVLSQVEAGFTRSMSVPEPARRYYQVETLVFGRAVACATKPERFIVGCADPAQPLDPRYRAVLDAFSCPVLPMRYESAELAKISINCCLVASVSVANMLAELCEGIGADWSEIVPALKLDRRIGPFAYLAPGLGIAGGNLERDLATVCRLAEAHGSDAGVVEAWRHNSRHRRDWAVRTIRETVLSRNPQAVIAVWGLAYKENTHSVKNSPALATIRQLKGVAIRVHDPVVPVSAVAGSDATGVDEPLQATAGAEALMILTPWPDYGRIAPAEISRSLRGRIVLDPYAVLDRKAAETAGLAYYTLGRRAAGKLD
ncbi:MAG: UDP binding domain-containing protein [Xanthobacteraceae bacterium]